MRPLSSAQVLALWDAGQPLHPIDRALLALALAMPEEAPEAMADRPVGWREANLLALRNAMFGSALDGYASCPACGALLEFGLDGQTLLDELQSPDSAARIALDGRQWRLPSSRDQAAILAAPDLETAVDWLLGRCRLAESGSGGVAAVDPETKQNPKCPPALVDELESRMEALDPAANIRLGMRCADCGHAWEAALDIGSCFWDELGSRARQLLESVHRLAGAYGWRESEILALSPARRAAYLNMIG